MLVVGGDNLIDLIEISRDDAAVSFAGARGGSGYNTARATARQGQDVGFITPIAQDNLGIFWRIKWSLMGWRCSARDQKNPRHWRW